MKAIIDTNVVLDVLCDRDEFSHDSMAVLSMCAKRDMEGIITTNSVTDIFYLTAKRLGRARARSAIKDLLSIVRMVSLDPVDIERAFVSEFEDLEDAVLVAVCLRVRADYLITRDEELINRLPYAISPAAFLI